jgi:hypothetical protein
MSFTGFNLVATCMPTLNPAQQQLKLLVINPNTCNIIATAMHAVPKYLVLEPFEYPVSVHVRESLPFKGAT